MKDAYENSRLGQIDIAGATPATPSLHGVLLQLYDNLFAINARMIDLHATYYGPTPQAEGERATKDLSCECLHDLVRYIHEYGNDTRDHVSRTVGQVIESLSP